MSNSTLNSTNTKGEATFNLYGYEPAKSPAYAYLALFAIVAAVHFIMMFPLRAAFFIPLVIGCSAEAGAYYLRAWSSTDTHKILPFVLSNLLILTAPPLLAATIYMTFGRIIRSLHGEACSLLSPKWQTTIFVLGDLFCLCSQLAGSILSASDDAATSLRGKHVILMGLSVQVAMFSLFTILCWIFQARFSRTSTSGKANGLKWRRHIVVLYVLSIIFVVRNLVRIVEFLQGSDGYITTHEAMLYIFDATFMLSVLMLLACIHPGGLIKVARRVDKMEGFENEMTPFGRQV